MSNEVWVDKGKGRTISINVRLFTDAIAKSGDGYVRQRHAWFKGEVGFIHNPAHELRSIGGDPIMFNRPEDLIDAIYKAARVQGVTILDPETKEVLA